MVFSRAPWPCFHTYRSRGNRRLRRRRRHAGNPYLLRCRIAVEQRANAGIVLRGVAAAAVYLAVDQQRDGRLIAEARLNLRLDGADQAQARADRIRAFQSELAVLQREGVVSLSDAAQDAVQQYHSGLLRGYAAEFDVDTSPDQKQLSWGMRLASLFGALALSAAVFFYYPGGLQDIAQDWELWAREGLLDYVFPMNYSRSTAIAANISATPMSTPGITPAR